MNEWQEDDGINGRRRSRCHGHQQCIPLRYAAYKPRKPTTKSLFLFFMLIFLISTHNQLILNHFITEQRFNNNQVIKIIYFFPSTIII
jgi:hypothetical protein